VVVDRAEHPIGDPTIVKLTLKIVLPRALAERLTARAIEENKKLDHRAEEILEAAANGGSAETAKPSQRQEAGLVSPGRNRRRKASQLNLYS